MKTERERDRQREIERQRETEREKETKRERKRERKAEKYVLMKPDMEEGYAYMHSALHSIFTRSKVSDQSYRNQSCDAISI